MIVTAHAPPYLPGLSVVEKIEAADMVIWLDTVQFTHGGWTNRQRMPDGSWLTVPIQHNGEPTLVKDVQIAPGSWKRKHIRTLRQQYGRSEQVEQVCDAIADARESLLALNLACLRVLAHERPWLLQSWFPVRSPEISEQLAAMVRRIEGDTYLSGPSGRNYLDEQPFTERGITVRYHTHEGPNLCCLSRYAKTRSLSTV